MSNLAAIQAVLGLVVFRIILGVGVFVISAFVLKWIFRINRIVELLERISGDIRALNRRVGPIDKE